MSLIRKVSDRPSIQWKFLLLVGPPLAGFVAVALIVVLQARHEASEAENTLRVAQLNGAVNELVSDLQRERGTAAVYLSSSGTRFGSDVRSARRTTDESRAVTLLMLDANSQALPTSTRQAFDDALSETDNVAALRLRADLLQVPEPEMTDAYSVIIEKLILVSEELTAHTDDADVLRGSADLRVLLKITEAAGRERALLGAKFASNERFTPEETLTFGGLRDRQADHIRELRANATPEIRDELERIDSDPTSAEVGGNVKTAFANHTTGRYGIDPLSWFIASTRRIELFNSIVDDMNANIVEITTDAKSAADRKTTIAVFALAALVAPVVIAAPLLSGEITRDITRRVRAEKALVESEARSQAVLDAAVDAIITVDGRGTIEGFNEAAVQMFGRNASEAVGRSVDLLFVDAVACTGDDPDGILRLAGELEGRRRDDTAFPVDVTVTDVDLDNKRLFTLIARDATTRKRHEARLKGLVDVAQAILRGEPVPDVLRRIASAARRLVDGAYAVVSLPVDGDLGRCVAVDGLSTEELAGTEFSLDGSYSGRVMRTGKPLVVEETAPEEMLSEKLQVAAGGPLLVAPLLLQYDEIGALAVGNPPTRQPFDEEDLAVVRIFSAQAAVALRYARTHEELAVRTERERIAMDLHDGVIQSLFSIGMFLEAAESAAGDGKAGKQLDFAINSIDKAIIDLRNYILALRRDLPQEPQLGAALRAQAEDFEETTGIHVVLDIDARPGALVGGPTGDLLQVAREALSNVARHAGAATVHLTLAASNGDAVLSIQDDGHGFDPEMVSVSGNGLVNLPRRVESLGGHFELQSAVGEGTCVVASVPTEIADDVPEEAASRGT